LTAAGAAATATTAAAATMGAVSAAAAVVIATMGRFTARGGHFRRGLGHDAQALIAPTIFRRNGLPRQALDIAHQRAFIIGAQADGLAGRPGPRGAADAVDVSLRHIG